MNCQRTPETLIGDSLRIISINLCHFQVVPGNTLRFALLASQHPKNPAEEVGGNVAVRKYWRHQFITTPINYYFFVAFVVIKFIYLSKNAVAFVE